MKAIYPVIIRGVGSYVPDEVVDNDFFSSYLDTSDEWITKRSGIHTRRRVAAGEATSTMAVEAGRRAIKDAGLSPSDINMVIVCTSTPDYQIPNTAGLVQHALGIENIPAFDLAATCSGLIYGITVASGMLTAGGFDNILVIGAETLTRFTDYDDRTTCILFGDGAGALVMSRSEDSSRGVLYKDIGADGAHLKCFWVPAGGSLEPTTERTANERLHYMRMRGRELFKIAVTKMESLVDLALQSTELGADDLALVIPHQSNYRIIESVRTRLRLPKEKVAVNIDRYGNTSSASIGLALDEARHNGSLNEGDLVLMVAFGAGVTWGTLIMRL